jgi:membrane-bound lytic murein transglycosylase A
VTGFRRILCFSMMVLAAGVLAACSTMAPMPPVPPTGMQLTQAGFGDLAGWRDGDARAALTAFKRSCAALLARGDAAAMGGAQYAGTVGDWRPACEAAANAGDARGFFETNFVPYRVTQGARPALFTGYYEPEVHGSRTSHGAYRTPLYGVPSDLVSVDLGLFRDTYKGQRLAGRVVMNRLVPYPARADIVRAGLPQAAPLFYLDNAVDAFFLEIQGSGRVVLDDGSVVRAVFAGQNGQPYTAIGAVLVARGAMTREEVSAQSIRAWLAAHPMEADGLMNANASYVFFAERPIGDASLGAAGTQGVALTPEASLAVDTQIHALGVPVFLETVAPDANGAERSFDRLLVMQDTGGAIRGPLRGDVYWGFGAMPGAIAGRMRSEGRMNVLLPKAVAARLGASASFNTPP